MKEIITGIITMTFFAGMFATALACELDRPILYIDNETKLCVAWSDADQMDKLNPCLDEFGHWLDGAEHVWVDEAEFLKERDEKH